MAGDLFEEDVRKTAVISACGQYRYELTRKWDDCRVSLPVCMLNPSTADANNDDPTIRELIHFAKAWGYGGLLIVNLFAFRASKPADMMAAADPEGSANGIYIGRAFNHARYSNVPMLAAWGNGGVFNGGDQRMIDCAWTHLVNLVCLGKTNDGHPKHPMARGLHRISRDQQPLAYRHEFPEQR